MARTASQIMGDILSGKDKLLTTAEVAALFRVEERTILRWAVSGKLGSVRIPGNKRRYVASYVLGLLQEVADDPHVVQEWLQGQKYGETP